MRRHAGASTGATNGRSREADGTVGTGAPHRRRPRCRPIRGSTPGIGIPRSSSSRRCRAATTATSRGTLSCGSNISSRRRRRRLCRLNACSRRRPSAAPDLQGRPAVQDRPQPHQRGSRAPPGLNRHRCSPPQQMQVQPPQQHQQGVERRQPPAPGANDRGAPAGRAAAPGPEQGQRQGQGQGQGRGHDKAKGQEHDRDNEHDAGRQGKK